LERRIAELTSTSDLSARLAQALQRNEELEQENKVLRARLNQAVTAMADGSRKFLLSSIVFAERVHMPCLSFVSASLLHKPHFILTADRIAVRIASFVKHWSRVNCFLARLPITAQKATHTLRLELRSAGFDLLLPIFYRVAVHYAF